MSLAAEIEAITAPPADVPQAGRRAPREAPSGWEPRADWSDTEATIVTPAWDTATGVEPAEAELLAERDLDPATWTVTGVRYSEWQQSKRLEGGDRDTITLRAKRVTYAKRAPSGHTIDTDALVAQLAGARAVKLSETSGVPRAYVHAGGDYQLGKLDGDGIAGTVSRFADAIHDGTRRLESLVASGVNVEAIYLPQLGDCIEGYVSQGGSKQAHTGLALVEQVDLLIHLLTEQVRGYARYGIPVVVPVIPGNHDEARRSPVEGLEHDSYAVLAAKQLRRALDLAGGYDHVSIVAPPRGELTLTLDMAGVNVALAHGHQFRPGKAHDWWDGQHHGMQLAGDARLLLTAHTHHLRVEQSGIKTHMQVPALEGESRWWRHRTGQQSPPGMVTMLVGEHAGRPLTLPDGHRVHTGWEGLEVA